MFDGCALSGIFRLVEGGVLDLEKLAGFRSRAARTLHTRNARSATKAVPIPTVAKSMIGIWTAKPSVISAKAIAIPTASRAARRCVLIVT